MSGFSPTKSGTIIFLEPDETGLLLEHEGYPRAYGETLWVMVNGVSQTLGEWLADVTNTSSVQVFNAMFPLSFTQYLTSQYLSSVLATLPTVEPIGPGLLWDNGGVLCITAGASSSGLPSMGSLTDPYNVQLFNSLFALNFVQSLSLANLAGALRAAPANEPTTTGTVWNNGGVMSLTDGLGPIIGTSAPDITDYSNMVQVFNALFPGAFAAALTTQTLAAVLSFMPTVQPTTAGVLWSNGGVLCLS